MKYLLKVSILVVLSISQATLLVSCGLSKSSDSSFHEVSSEQVAAIGCNVYSFPKSTIEKIDQNPLSQRLYQSFQSQLETLKKENSPFGEKFTEYSPDLTAGYTEGYFSIYEKAYMDGINRKLIRYDQYDQNYKNYFQDLYSSNSDWNPNLIKRTSGVVFGGYKMSPTTLKENCGIWSNLLKPNSDNPKKREFQTLLENNKGLSQSSFNLSDFLIYTSEGIFVSTTRSIHVARKFALNTGSLGNQASEGYVYVILAHQGIDTFDSQNLNNNINYREQEISLTGVIAWSDIIGYRKILRSPSPGAPPEFTGPVFLRENLEQKEPAITREILRQLSVKSKFTEAFENHKDWQEIHNELSDHWKAFRVKYKWNWDAGT
jgi:hypothetical protein